MRNSIQLLEAAAQHQRDRAATYDSPTGERSMGKTVQAFNIITGKSLSEADGWLLVQILKDVRDQANGPHVDSLEDCIAYASLKAEARLRELTRGIYEQALKATAVASPEPALKPGSWALGPQD